MIIPYRHSGLKLYRIPWATIAIAGLCFLVFIVTSGASNRAAATSSRLFKQIVGLYAANPTLELDPEILERMLRFYGVDRNEREVFLESLAEQAVQHPQPGGKATQEELDRLTDEFWTAYRSAPDYRFGLKPAAMSPLTLITHQFMHGGWWHLAGNMLFLFLAGPYLEQRWGRPLFVGFYLSAGLVAGLFWAIRYPGLDNSLIGASGSIAGLMGAFLICFGGSKIRFFYWFFILWGTFEAPAWLMLPLWLAMEVVSGRQMDVTYPGLGGGGVAHWAHVWGFIFGMAVAWGLSVSGLDQRLTEREIAGSSAAPTPWQPTPPTGSTSAGLAAPIPAAGPATRHSNGLGSPSTSFPTSGEHIVPSVNRGPTVELRPADRLKVRDGVPKAIDGSELRFAVGDTARRLDLGRVEAIAIGAIAQPGGRPFVVVDLVLDPPWQADGDLRVLRLRSSSFDPRTIVGGERTVEAFTRLLDRLLTAGSAVPLPDADHLRSPGSTTYASLDDYQRQVLGVVGPATG